MTGCLVDYHVHTDLCGHATGSVSQYLDEARALGLTEIGFADHLPMLDRTDPSLTMSWDQLPGYIEEVRRAARESGDLRVRLGVEADYLPGLEDELARRLSLLDLDYVIGSVHFVDGWGIDDRRYLDRYDEYDIDDLYAKYFEQVIIAAQTGLFDVMAHPDLIKKYGFRPNRNPGDIYRRVAEALAGSGACAEVSSAGLRKPVGEIYPEAQFLKALHEAGVAITVGSDAHKPEDVGRDLGQVVNLVRSVGYTEVSVFSGRRRQDARLEDVAVGTQEAKGVRKA